MSPLPPALPSFPEREYRGGIFVFFRRQRREGVSSEARECVDVRRGSGVLIKSSSPSTRKNVWGAESGRIVGIDRRILPSTTAPSSESVTASVTATHPKFLYRMSLTAQSWRSYCSCQIVLLCKRDTRICACKHRGCYWASAQAARIHESVLPRIQTGRVIPCPL